MAIMRLINLILVEMVWNTLKSQENCLSWNNETAIKCLSFEIGLNQKKSCQKVRIQSILI